MHEGASSNDDSLPVNDDIRLSYVDSIVKTVTETVIDETSRDDVDLTGLNELFKEPEKITWDIVVNLDTANVIKWQLDCPDLKHLFDKAYPHKQDHLNNHFFVNNGMLMKYSKYKVDKLERE